MRFFCVLTTINVPTLLRGYCDNIARYGWKDQAGFIVIGDKKTPEAAADFVHGLAQEGFETLYYSVAEQERWLQDFPKLATIIPYNTDNRRNIGFLIAAQRGADVIIALDDDNYAMDNDFVGDHSVVGTRQKLPAITSPDGWFNICSLMDATPDLTFYPRGFPYSQRGKDVKPIEGSFEGRVVMNAGLWLDDPDVDAVTRLNGRVKTTGLRRERIALTPGTWCPVNTQNTAFHREVLPAYYYVIMGYSIGGLKLDRYGDIWSGYFARKVVDHMGDIVSCGRPLVRHERNSHNLFKDLEQEFYGMVLTENLVRGLRSFNLTGKSYPDAYASLADSLRSMAKSTDWSGLEVQPYFEKIIANMHIWLDACARIL